MEGKIEAATVSSDVATITLDGQESTAVEVLGLKITSLYGGHKITRSPAGGRGGDKSYIRIKIEKLDGTCEPVEVQVMGGAEVEEITRSSDNKKLKITAAL